MTCNLNTGVLPPCPLISPLGIIKVSIYPSIYLSIYQVKESVLNVIEEECQELCKDKDFMLWRCSPEDLKAFSFKKMESELKEKAPFLFSLLSRITKDSPLQTCAAASVALRGRNPMLSSFAFYVNSVLQLGGAKKAVSVASASLESQLTTQTQSRSNVSWLTRVEKLFRPSKLIKSYTI